jgi:hypothetical protein
MVHAWIAIAPGVETVWRNRRAFDDGGDSVPKRIKRDVVDVLRLSSCSKKATQDFGFSVKTFTTRTILRNFV